MSLPDEELRRILADARRIAVVGLGDNPGRPAYSVARYLQKHGYQIAPIHPRDDETLGQRVFRSLEDAAAAGPVDIVDVFRRSDAIPSLVAPCVAIRPRVVWLQVGVRNDAAAEALEAAGIPVVQNRCLAVEHNRLAGTP
jgi:predicted CoA-binding protein